MANQEIDLVDSAAASASASASCSACAAVSTKKYDVFISFRGEDTRTNFTSHLHEALCRNKIETYIDYRIDKGDEVWPALVKAIEESILFLIVFSEHYASSTWCLNELTKMLESTQDQDHLVIPIFYKIDPSHVRKQTGTYQSAFEKHENNNQKQHIPKWRSALTHAANLSGWPCNADRNEAELIGEIIKCVLKKLEPKFTSESSGHVGIRERTADLESLLFQGSQHVRFIGIWGMGGIGKTTLATTVFNKLRFAYEGSCFLANVREESQKCGIIQLKNKLLSTLLEEKDSHVGMPHGETPYAMRLGRKKVLIVLDDVNDVEQIEKLAGEHSWFGPGSRIIITTRDKQVINNIADDIYEVKALHFDEALQLFYLNAFKNNSIDKGFEQLSRKVVDYTKGIPLAIKVLASLLCGRGKKEWESQLEKLQKMPCTKIQQVLRLSYDGLDHQEKNIFLDVACFFKGEKVERIKVFLDACGYSTIIGLQSLEEKALLTISEEKKVSMHDLIQDMGREIIREESMEDPEKRSRLWDPEDIYQVLNYNLGTEAIRGITLDVSKIEDLYLKPQVFGRMHKLKFLQIYKSSDSEKQILHLPRGLKSLSNELRYLEWDGYPLKSLPSKFSAEKLVMLKLQNTQVRQLWNGSQNLVNLREIDLQECQHLIELPDFSKARCLESMSLVGCECLRNVHPSIFSLGKLECLKLYECESITSLKTDVHLTSLRDLSLFGCPRLEEFSVVSENMEYLFLERTAINALPSSVGNLSKLVQLSLDGCERLENLPNKLADLQSLSQLILSGCTQLNTSNLRCIFDGLEALEYLYLDDCCNLFELPDNICQLSSLASLSMRNTSVQSLPTSIEHLPNLKLLILDGCRRLRSLLKLPPSINELFANNCTSLQIVQFTSTAVMPRTEVRNCLKLHEYSLKAITASLLLQINGMRMLHSTVEAKVVYPGCKIPEWLTYRTTQASITIDISTSPHSKDWGLIFCAIVPPFLSDIFSCIDCTVYKGDSCPDEDDPAEIVEIVSTTSWISNDLKSDHVLLLYDGGFCSQLCKTMSTPPIFPRFH